MRLETGWTQAELGEIAGVTRHAVIRTEQGVYALPPPAILSVFLRRFPGESILTLETVYVAWVEETRRHNASKYLNREPPVTLVSGDMAGVDFLLWRLNTMRITSRMEFCRLFCVHPAVVEKYEKGQQKHMPDQLQHALYDVGLLSHLATH